MGPLSCRHQPSRSMIWRERICDARAISATDSVVSLSSSSEMPGGISILTCQDSAYFTACSQQRGNAFFQDERDGLYGVRE